MIKDDRYTHVTILPLWVIEYQMTKVFCVLFHIIVTFGNRIVDRKYPPPRSENLHSFWTTKVVRFGCYEENRIPG